MSGTTGPAYDFDAEMQTEIAALSMWDFEFLRRTEGLVRPEYFGDEVEAGFIRLAGEFYTKHREVPSKTAWMQMIRDGFAAKPPMWRDDLKPDVVAKLSDTLKMDVRSRDFILDKVAEFAKQQELLNALVEAADGVGRTHDPDRFKRIEERMSRAFKVGLQDNDEDYDYFERLEQRTTDRVEIAAGGRPKTGVTTGIKELNDLLFHGGWGRAELSAFMGAMKSGKSFNLTAASAEAVLAGFNVLLVTLENSAEIQAGRIDAFFSEIGISEQIRQPHAIHSKVEAAAARPDMGKLKIRRFPGGTFRPKDLERILEDYQVKNVSFDLIVVDYLDIMAPDVAFDSERDASKHIWTRVRAIAGTYRGPRGHPAMLSATQTNREGAKAATATGTHVSEDINKMRIADLVISINRTDEERNNSKARLHMALGRNQADGMTLFVTQDLDKGKAVVSVESIE